MKTAQAQITPSNQDAAIYKAVHDIRSPIAIMNLSLGMIKEFIPDNNLELMENAVKRMNCIVDDLLEEHSSFKIKRMDRELSLFALLDYAIQVKNYEWQNDPCKIILVSDPQDRSSTVFAKENEISRLVSNLLNNAYESLLYEKKDIQLILKTENLRPVVIIKDVGCGIAKDQINFVLSGNSTKENGHGLGLSSALSYMKSIGGELLLSSVENRGTEIKLTF